MKKILALIMILTMGMSMTACNLGRAFEITFTIPKGNSTDEYVYSEQEISPVGRKIKVSLGTGISETEIAFKSVSDGKVYEVTYLTHGEPVYIRLKDDEWYKIGIKKQNDSDVDMAAEVVIEGADIRIVSEAVDVSAE